MFTFNRQTIKILTLLLSLCFLSSGIHIYFYDSMMAGKNHFALYIGLLQYLIYIYNLIIFKQFLETELGKRSLNLLIKILIFYYTLVAFTILNLLYELISSGKVYIEIISMFFNFISLFFVIVLFRLETEKYKQEINIIATTLMVSFLFNYISMFIYAITPTYSYLSRWFPILYLLPDLAYVLLYRKVILNMDSKEYLKPEDRFRIG